MYHLQGMCKFTSETCAFAHTVEEMRENKGLAKKSPKSGAGEQKIEKTAAAPVNELPQGRRRSALAETAPAHGEASRLAKQASRAAPQKIASAWNDADASMSPPGAFGLLEQQMLHAAWAGIQWDDVLAQQHLAAAAAWQQDAMQCNVAGVAPGGLPYANAVQQNDLLMEAAAAAALAAARWPVPQPRLSESFVHGDAVFLPQSSAAPQDTKIQALLASIQAQADAAQAVVNQQPAQSLDFVKPDNDQNNLNKADVEALSRSVQTLNAMLGRIATQTVVANQNDAMLEPAVIASPSGMAAAPTNPAVRHGSKETFMPRKVELSPELNSMDHWAAPGMNHWAPYNAEAQKMSAPPGLSLDSWQVSHQVWGA